MFILLTNKLTQLNWTSSSYGGFINQKSALFMFVLLFPLFFFHRPLSDDQPRNSGCFKKKACGKKITTTKKEPADTIKHLSLATCSFRVRSENPALLRYFSSRMLLYLADGGAIMDWINPNCKGHQ